MKKQSRTEIFSEMVLAIPAIEAARKEYIYSSTKGGVKTLQDMADMEYAIQEQDIIVKIFDLIISNGFDTYQKLEDEYSKIEEGAVKHNDELHNAIVAVVSFIDDQYSNQILDEKIKERLNE